jgi:hypothetical protein
MGVSELLFERGGKVGGGTSPDIGITWNGKRVDYV